ncbi:Protein kinase domain-containing protein [Mycena kentingensis (nom. inval.)]|nr:Protein kinase domain-containing protein [Mycena kentingensis (nom. inval.)]
MSPAPAEPIAPSVVELIANHVFSACLSQLNNPNANSSHYCSLTAPCRPAHDALTPFFDLQLVGAPWRAAVAKIQAAFASDSNFFTAVEQGVYYPHKWHINTRMRSAVLLGRYRTFKTITSEAAIGGVFLAYDFGAPSGCFAARQVILKSWVSGTDFELRRETAAYDALDGCPGTLIPLTLPRVQFDAGCDVHVLALPKLGLTLAALLERLPGRRMSAAMVFTVAIQMLTRLEDIHARGLVYCGLKPDNICLSPRESADPTSTLYAIDYGFSLPLADNMPLPSAHRIDVVGNRRFMSVFAHHGISQSQRDDLESLAYLLSYLFHGSLPWDSPPPTSTPTPTPAPTSKAPPHQQQYLPQLWRIKMATPPSVLFRSMHPSFLAFWRELKGLAYGEVPQYGVMRRRFEEAASAGAKEGGTEAVVDWWAVWDESRGI